MLKIWRIRIGDFLVSVLQSWSFILPCTPVMSWPLFMICVLSALPFGTHFTHRLGLCTLHFISVSLRFIFFPPFSHVLCLVRRGLRFALCIQFSAVWSPPFISSVRTEFWAREPFISSTSLLISALSCLIKVRILQSMDHLLEATSLEEGWLGSWEWTCVCVCAHLLELGQGTMIKLIIQSSFCSYEETISIF